MTLAQVLHVADALGERTPDETNVVGIFIVTSSPVRLLIPGIIRVCDVREVGCVRLEKRGGKRDVIFKFVCFINALHRTLRLHWSMQTSRTITK